MKTPPTANKPPGSGLGGVARVPSEDENRPLIRRADSGLGTPRSGQAAHKPQTPTDNVFKLDEAPSKPKPPASGSPGVDAWPSTKPDNDIGSKIKNYIKDISKLIDDGMPGQGNDDEEEDEEDEDNIEEVPTVPDTDDSSKQVARDDEIEDEGIEESKGG